jgi:hypothetical protein
LTKAPCLSIFCLHEEAPTEAVVATVRLEANATYVNGIILSPST